MAKKAVISPPISHPIGPSIPMPTATPRTKFCIVSSELDAATRITYGGSESSSLPIAIHEV